METTLTKWQQARLHGLCAGKHLALFIQELWRAITAIFGKQIRWFVLFLMAMFLLALFSGCQTTYQLPPPDSLPKGEYQVQPDGSLKLIKRESILI